MTTNIFVLGGQVLFLTIAFFLACLYWHEAGHALYMKYSLKKKPRQRFTWRPLKLWTECDCDINTLTNDEKKGLYMSGVLLGLVPLLLLALIGTQASMGAFFSVTVLYVIGCSKDLKQFVEVLKSEDSNTNLAR